MANHSLDPTRWIDLHADYLFNYAITRVNDREVARDIIQDTFFAGLKSKDNFKGQASERTWLVSILKRKIIDHYRKVNSNKGKAEIKIGAVSDEDEGDWLEKSIRDHDGNAENAIENEELGDAISNCMGKLPDKQAQIFKMKTIEGYTTEAICKELNITASNLWVIIHRARTALADCLREKWF
ncbi:MAG: sigma-70 family RNA polymerase sigma factor [Sinomicrobium sp.]|nr:sigma-70 family RNA polymerase sigma factor [Sinomicrobium sp.]